LKSSEIVECFFTAVEVADKVDMHKCICGSILKQKKSSGLTNLINHINNKHAGYEGRVKEIVAAKNSGRTYVQLRIEDFVDKGALSTLNWLKLIVKKICLSPTLRTKSS
jgi:hypothetical protein